MFKCLKNIIIIDIGVNMSKVTIILSPYGLPIGAFGVQGFTASDIHRALKNYKKDDGQPKQKNIIMTTTSAKIGEEYIGVVCR